jgi:hypothetical protein
VGVKSKVLDTLASALATEIFRSDMSRNLDVTPSVPRSSVRLSEWFSLPPRPSSSIGSSSEDEDEDEDEGRERFSAQPSIWLAPEDEDDMRARDRSSFS